MLPTTLVLEGCESFKAELEDLEGGRAGEVSWHVGRAGHKDPSGVRSEAGSVLACVVNIIIRIPCSMRAMVAVRHRMTAVDATSFAPWH